MMSPEAIEEIELDCLADEAKCSITESEDTNEKGTINEFGAEEEDIR